MVGGAIAEGRLSITSRLKRFSSLADLRIHLHLDSEFHCLKINALEMVLQNLEIPLLTPSGNKIGFVR
jgi:hypothetical protein